MLQAFFENYANVVNILENYTNIVNIPENYTNIVNIPENYANIAEKIAESLFKFAIKFCLVPFCHHFIQVF